MVTNHRTKFYKKAAQIQDYYFKIDMPQIATACGYVTAKRVTTKEDLQKSIISSKLTDGVTFIEVRVRPGNRADIGRPTSTPAENKMAMMKFLNVGPKT